MGNSTAADAHNTYPELRRVAPDKPIVIAETGSVEQGGSKAEWIRGMLTHLPTKYPRVKAFVWTNVVEDGEGWPIESSPGAEAAFRKGIASAAYATNQYGTISGKIPAPGSASSPAAGAPAPAPPPAPGASSSVTLPAVLDTYTSSATPNTSEAGSHTLRANVVGTDTTYIRFNLASLAGKTITSAKLNLHTSTDSWSGSAAMFDVNFVPSDQWTESMTLANAVPISTTPLGTLTGPTSPNATYSIDLNVNALKTAGLLVSFALRSRTADVMVIDSRESGRATAPALTITYD
jgi:hypothetical protein